MKEYISHIELIKDLESRNIDVNNEMTIPWNDDILIKHPLKDYYSSKNAIKYLQKYWLDEQEYLNNWKPIQSSFFTNQSKWFPDYMINSNYQLLPLWGGKIFLSETLAALNSCLTQLNESCFVCIQNTFNDTYEGLFNNLTFRLKYPVGIKWHELNIGNYLTDTLLWGHNQDFYIFGENDIWAIYSATRSLYPVNLLLFKPEFKDLFIKYCLSVTYDKTYIFNCLPNDYRSKIPVGIL